MLHEILSRNTRDSTEVSISPGLGKVPGLDRHQDRQTELPLLIGTIKYASSCAYKSSLGHCHLY